MGTVDEVNQILQKDYGWSTLEAPEPFATEKALETMAPTEIAAKLDGYCDQYGGPGGYGYSQAIWDFFNIGVKYWRLNTLVALGIVVEETPEHIDPARSIDEWLQNMALGYGRTGFKDGGACSREDYAKRSVFAEKVPVGWRGKELQYRTLVLAGSIPVGLHGFDTMYYQTVNVDSVPLDPNKWFANVSTPQGAHVPWKSNGDENPEPPKVRK